MTFNRLHTGRATRHDAIGNRSISLLACAAVACWIACACSATPSQIELLSFKQIEDPVRYAETFERSHYCRDAHGNWLIVMEIPPVWVESGASEAPSGLASANQSGWTSQLVQVEVFWVPYPGRTHAESTQTNAAITYHLVKPSSVVTYEGAGFVYFQPPKPGKPIIGRIESGSLLRAPDVSESADLFGPCRLRGTITAVEDRRAVFGAINEIKRTRARAVASGPAAADTTPAPGAKD